MRRDCWPGRPPALAGRNRCAQRRTGRCGDGPRTYPERGDRQHATGQHAEAIRFTVHSSQLPHTPRVDVAAPPQLPAVGMRPGGAHARSCVLGEPERAEELGQQVRRQQDIHAPRWERRHLGDEGVGLVLELGRALAGVHCDLQELRVREVGEARRQAHEWKERGARFPWLARATLRRLGAVIPLVSCLPRLFGLSALGASFAPQAVTNTD